MAKSNANAGATMSNFPIVAEGDAIKGKMRDFTFGDNKLSLPIDSLSDELAEKTQIFLDGVQSDYDRGQQQNADKGEALNVMLSLSDETLNTYAQGSQLRHEIHQLFQEDLTSLQQSNPDYARHVSNALVQKQLELKVVVSDLGKQEQEIAQTQYVEVERQRKEGVSILNQKYENFSTEKAPELIKYVISKGMRTREANNWALNPLAAELGYKAMLFDRDAD